MHDYLDTPFLTLVPTCFQSKSISQHHEPIRSAWQIDFPSLSCVPLSATYFYEDLTTLYENSTTEPSTFADSKILVTLTATQSFRSFSCPGIVYENHIFHFGNHRRPSFHNGIALELEKRVLFDIRNY